ncbi:glycosyltransferase family 2 protein [Flammula alnicola]|nr:glycosyltransferase family 2 protein [Flammula alnicola]
MLYLTSDDFPIFVPFGVIGFYRYLWYLIRLAAATTYRPIPLPENPTYIASEDVTIIVPTIDAGEEFKEAANSWLVGKPKEILIITEEKMLGPLQDLANQRLQMSHGIKNTTTDIIVFADDDAIWPPTMLPYVLACFEDQKVGGVGTSQRVQSVGSRMTVWEVLAAFRLTIRNIEIASSTHIDGGLPCLSGRTAAYRTVILKDPDFLHGFTHDYWLGKYQLNSGDDKFLTRWMVSHGWNTYVQCCKEVELLSTMKPNWRFLKQVLRWTRNTWRSDLRSLFMERHIWTSHPYVAYTMVDKLFNPLTLLVGPCLVSYLMYKSTIPVDQGGYHLPWNILLSYFVWLSATRTLKLMPHLWHQPEHIIYTGWGTRAGIGDASAATAALAAQDKMQDEKNNNPYQQQRSYSVNEASPFADEPSPYRDDPNTPSSATPIFSTRHTGRKASVGHRRRAVEDDGVELQVGFAR